MLKGEKKILRGPYKVNLLEETLSVRGFRHAVLTMNLLVLSYVPMVLLSGCRTPENAARSMAKTTVYTDELVPAAESSRYWMPRKWDSDCKCWVINTRRLRTHEGEPMPHRWDTERKKWVVDTRRLKTKEGDLMPHRWDSERKKWVVDTRRMRTHEGKPMPHRWDSESKKWVVDTRRLKTKEGEPMPHRWDSERRKWVIDTNRIKADDYYPGMESE